jgi:SAM-dependent methyltransferase
MNQTRRRARGLSATLGRLSVVEDGEGVKLFAHGTLYSIRPRRIARTPAPWLALAAAPWMVAPRGPRSRAGQRIGFLGYGGGAVARLVRAGAGPGAQLVGVEPDPEVRRLAGRNLGADDLRVRIVTADAMRYLRRRGPRFDALLDDIYAPRAGRLARPESCADLPRLARRRLEPGGVYAVNLISPGGIVERATIDSIRRSFRHLSVIFTRRYAHKVIVASDSPFARGALGRALKVLLSTAGGPVGPAALGLGPVRRIR